MNNNEEVHFQNFSFDRQLNRNRNSILIDGGAMPAKNNASLSPRAYSDQCGDKSVTWELEQELDGLEDLLK